MSQTSITSIKLPKEMNQQLSKQVIEDGYGMRGKSRWIADSVSALLKLDESGYIELVEYAAHMDQLDDVISIRLPLTLIKDISQAVRSVRKIYPELEGVKSGIIRASILQNLIR